VDKVSAKGLKNSIFSRKGFNTIIDLCFEEKIDKFVIAHKDVIGRLYYDFIKLI
jgi:predicted site-specific integrase-resolvase